MGEERGKREKLTHDDVLELAAHDASYCDDRSEADRVLRRGRERAEALLLLPEGWHVERVARQDFLRRLDGEPSRWEVAFELHGSDSDGHPVAKPYLRWSNRAGEYELHAGTQSGGYETDEARGRAVVLLLAAIECDARNSWNM